MHMTYAYIRRQIEGLGHTKFQARKQLFLYTIRLTTSHAAVLVSSSSARRRRLSVSGPQSNRKSLSMTYEAWNEAGHVIASRVARRYFAPFDVIGRCSLLRAPRESRAFAPHRTFAPLKYAHENHDREPDANRLLYFTRKCDSK